MGLNLNLHNVKKVPLEVERIIYSYIPPQVLMLLNKENYKRHHYLLHNKIRGVRFQSFIRMMLRKDYSFLFKFYMRENIKSWNGGKYVYKNIVYANYFHFLSCLAIDINSTKCKKEMEIFKIKHTLKKYKNKNIQRIWTN